MKVGKILLSGLVATSLMTLFSYLASNAEKENFKEPELLAELEDEALPAKSKYLALPAGWVTHFSIGILWALFYGFIWEKMKIKPTTKSGLALGAFSGVTGIIIWDTAFRLHPKPPKTNFKQFYKQLFFAHLVYSLTATYVNKVNKE